MRYFILLFAFVAMCAVADTKQIIFECKAGFIPDGDTVFVEGGKYDGKRIRLKGIDAPERTQAFSRKSQKMLLQKIKGKTLKVVVHELDKYDRFLGTIYLGDRNINREMVAEGWAWAYTYKGFTELYEAEMKKARADKLGLWQDKSPEAPWDFRRKQKN